MSAYTGVVSPVDIGAYFLLDCKGNEFDSYLDIVYHVFAECVFHSTNKFSQVLMLEENVD